MSGVATGATGVPKLADAAGDLEYLIVRRVHETFRILGEELFIREIRMVVENTGPRAAYFVLGPLHRKYRQVDLEAYDRDSLCEFIPSARSVDFVTLFILYKILAELRKKIEETLASKGVEQAAVETSVRANVAKAREAILGPLRELVDSKPAEAQAKLTAVHGIRITIQDAGKELAVFDLQEALSESGALLSIVGEWYYEVIHLREPIAPNGFRVVNVRSREVPSIEPPRKAYRWSAKLTVRLPFASLTGSATRGPSTHLRLIPPEGLRFRVPRSQAMRYLEALWGNPGLILGLALAVVVLVSVSQSLLALTGAALLGIGGAVLSLRVVRLCKTGFFQELRWRSKSGEEEGFASWRNELSITRKDGAAIDTTNLVIAQQDSQLTYLVFLGCPPGIYDIQVSSSLPRVHDSAPYLLSLFVWGIAYLTWSAYIVGSELDPSSLLASFGAGLHSTFPTVPGFVTSSVLPAIALGVSMTITSLIHYLNRTAAQRGLLSGYMTWLMCLMAAAVLFPMILIVSTLK